MKLKTTAHLLLGLALIGSTTANASEYLVKYRNSYAIRNMSINSNVRVQDINETAQLLKVNIKEDSKVMGLVDLVTDPNVEYVVPNAKLYAFSAPVDTEALKEQWAISKVRAEAAWQRAGNKGSKNVVVAVIDTGVDYRHESLAPNMVAGYNFVNNNEDPMDKTGSQNPGHGTHCAGIIGATGLKDGGIIGLSPEVSMMPLRFLDERGSGDLNNGIKAIDYAISKGVQVISASWGAKIPRNQAMPLIEAVQRAEKAGIVFVVAAANDGKNNDTNDYYPTNADLSNTIAVAASNSSDAKPSWSNFGRAKVNVAAPGDAIMSTLPANKYGNLSGTSMATPLVAGLVALIKAQDSSLTPSQIRSLIQSTGAKVSIETACDCRIDAFAAVDSVISKKMFVSPFAGTLAKGSETKFEAVYGTAPFTFTSSNTSVATIDNNGVLKAIADGETTVTVKDANGSTATSYKIFVGAKSGGGDDGGDGGDGGGGGECPIGDPVICEIACQIQPDLPWCSR